MICFGVMAEMMSRIYHESSDNATYAIRHSFSSESQVPNVAMPNVAMPNVAVSADAVVGHRLRVLDPEKTNPARDITNLQQARKAG
jgi:hypothetical protein